MFEVFKYFNAYFFTCSLQ